MKSNKVQDWIEINSMVVSKIEKEYDFQDYPNVTVHFSRGFGSDPIKVKLPLGSLYWYEHDPEGASIYRQYAYKFELGDEYVLKLEKVRSEDETETLGFSGA